MVGEWIADAIFAINKTTSDLPKGFQMELKVEDGNIDLKIYSKGKSEAKEIKKIESTKEAKEMIDPHVPSAPHFNGDGKDWKASLMDAAETSKKRVKNHPIKEKYCNPNRGGCGKVFWTKYYPAKFCSECSGAQSGGMHLRKDKENRNHPIMKEGKT
jgi:hypothetical protein